MRKIKFLFAMFIVKATLAQPVFTSANCFSVNDSAKANSIYLMQDYSAYVANTGRNHSWNFVDGGISGPWGDWVKPTASYVFRRASLAQAASFGQSEINEYSVLPVTRHAFYTYADDKDTLYLDGIILASSQYPRSPRIPYLSFPLSFGDSVFSYTKQFVPGQPTRESGSASRTWIYDGYGTVSFPFKANIGNVYRIRTKQVDSIYVLNSAQESEEIIWFEGSTGIPILRFQKSGTAITVWYADIEGVTTSLNYANIANTDIEIYPNPVTDRLMVKHAEHQQIKQIAATDLAGKTFLLDPTNATVTDLNNGMYIISVEFTNGKSLAKKVLVQH